MPTLAHNRLAAIIRAFTPAITTGIADISIWESRIDGAAFSGLAFGANLSACTQTPP